VPITIAGLAADPSPVTRRLMVAGTAFTVRALLPEDTAAMAGFLAGLSATSCRFWHRDADPAEQAAEWVEAIGRYDKLPLVVHGPDRPDRFDAMVDLSFCVPDFAELSRYAGYGIALDPARTVRFGPCVADAWQGSRGACSADVERGSTCGNRASMQSCPSTHEPAVRSGGSASVRAAHRKPWQAQ
jgi:hypothetical protein